jgi:choline dehydrogenase-like flavoprotein
MTSYWGSVSSAPGPAAGTSPSADVVVVGSGAGGGVIAGELASRGRDVVLLEAGPHRTAADFSRWEAHGMHDLWWPTRFAAIDGGAEMVFIIGGRCVGGTTTINTKVALRAHDADFAKWSAAAGLRGADGGPFTIADLAAHYDRVEQRLGVRERRDWSPAVRNLVPGFEALGLELEASHAYTDYNCMQCGSCIQGCPTNSGKNTMNVYIHPPWKEGRLDLRAECPANRILIEDRDGVPTAVGVEYTDPEGQVRTIAADVVVVAGGALNTPQLMLRSGMGSLPSGHQIGRNVGWHPVRLVCGLFDEIQDAHMIFPIMAHSTNNQTDEQGGYMLEAATVQDPIGFASGMTDEDGPVWGQRLVDRMKRYRYWGGVLAMVTDDNHGQVAIDADGNEQITGFFSEVERKRLDDALEMSKKVLAAAGATELVWSGISCTHVQGSVRMGADPARSAVDGNAESHDVKRLFVGDGSVIPTTISVNPSLTIMAMADRLADHIDADASGYLSGNRAAAAA